VLAAWVTKQMNGKKAQLMVGRDMPFLEEKNGEE